MFLLDFFEFFEILPAQLGARTYNKHENAF